MSFWIFHGNQSSDLWVQEVERRLNRRENAMKLDKKFYVSGAGGDIIPCTVRKAKDGSVVPDNEWVVFLAKDNAFAAVLPVYYTICEALGADEEHLAAVSKLIQSVNFWRSENPERCKVPDAKGEKLLP